MTRRDEHLRRRLEAAPLPDAADAERRAWELARAAAPPLRLHSSRSRRLRAGLALTLAGAAGVLAATPPGEAIGDWLKRAVDRTPVTRTVARTDMLPAPGRLLAGSPSGIAIVDRDGDRTRLGDYDGAAWSPRGLFVVAWRGRSLSALDADGDVRWRITTVSPIRGGARWSPDGYRIAYVTATGWLHVVAGDGSGDRPLARARPVAPEWRPGRPHTIAYVTRGGRIEVRDVDTWRAEYRSPRPLPSDTGALSWSADGRRIAVAGRRGVHGFDLRGRVTHAAGGVIAAAFAPTGGRLALIAYRNGSSRVTIGDRTLFTAAGRFKGLVWSPDGRWLLIATPAAGQWVAVRTRGAAKLATLDGRAASPAGWCCAASAVYGRAAPTRSAP